MNINNHPQASDLYTQKINPRDAAKPSKPIEASKAEPESVGEKVELSKLDALRNEPEIRPEVVAKGKELLNDPNYPS